MRLRTRGPYFASGTGRSGWPHPWNPGNRCRGDDTMKKEELEYVWGINIVPVSVAGWQAWALLDTGPHGYQRPIAFLDEDALTRIHDQSGAALKQITEDRGDNPCPL